MVWKDKREKGFPKWTPACALTETLCCSLCRSRLLLTRFLLTLVFLLFNCFSHVLYVLYFIYLQHNNWYTRFDIPSVVFYVLFGFSVVCLFFNICRRLIYFVLCSLLLFLLLSFFRWILLAPFFYFFFHVFPLLPPPSPPPLRHGSLLLLVAYVPVNVPPPAPTCPPSLIPALTLCCSQRPPVSQAAQGAPLPPPQRLHDLQTQNALPPEPEARGKCVFARQALCTCVFVSTPVSELCTCNTVWAKWYRGLKGHNAYMVS